MHNKRPDNIEWIVEIEDYKGPEPDWSWRWFDGSFRACLCQQYAVYTRLKINNEPYHSYECKVCFTKKGHAPNYNSPKTVGSSIVYFGSHKGKRLDETPITWRQWVMKQDTHHLKQLQKKIIVLDGLSV